MPLKRPRGRLETHWADKARVQYWYYYVSRSTGLSDYKLDVMFASPASASNELADRTRVFEKIRRLGQLPSRGKHWRSSHDLIAAVDEFLSGSRSHYEAEFWDLLKTPPPTLQETHARLEQCLCDLGLERVDWILEMERVKYAVEPHTLYIHSLSASLTTCSSPLERLKLLALLTRESDLAGNQKITELNRSVFDRYLDNFLSSNFPYEEYLDFYMKAIQEYCFAHRGIDASEAGLRSHLESRTSWLIVSSRQVTSIAYRKE